jgi:hypothetical protein
MLDKLANYLLILSTSIYLVYAYIMFASNDKIISEVSKSGNKFSYIWNKKARLALLLDEFAGTTDCVKSCDYLNNLVYGSDLDLNASK